MGYAHGHKFTKEECYFLIDNYKNFTATQLAEMMTTMFGYQFNRNQIKSKIGDLGLVKTTVRAAYTREMVEWLIDHFETVPLHDLVVLFNERFKTSKTVSGIWHKLNRIIDGGIVRDENSNRTRVQWTDEMVEWLKLNYETDPYNKLAIKMTELFNVSITSSAIEHKCNRLGLVKSKEAIAKYGCRGSAFWFQKGHPNFFKKPLGYERTHPDGYTWVKVAEPDVFRAKHRVVWEQYNGPIPPGHKVIFADGDKSNFNIDNLLLVTNSELVILNRNKLIFKGKPDLTKIGHLITKVKGVKTRK